MSRISTSSSGGNVNIQDTNGNAITASGGSLNVNITGTVAGGSDISVYNEVTDIAMGASSTVLTYTVPAGQTLNLTRVFCSSDSIGMIELDFDGSTNAKSYFSYTEYNLKYDYAGYLLPAGTVVTLIATNNSQRGVAAINATLQGVLN